MMKMHLLAASLLVPGLSSGPLAAQQTPAASAPTQLTPGPTTRVLAIGSLTGPPSPGLRPIMNREVRETVQLYLNGKIAEWFSRQDAPGVVFIMDVRSVDEARALLDALPLGVEKKMSFQLIPLGPLTPLRILASTPPVAGAPTEKP